MTALIELLTLCKASKVLAPCISYSEYIPLNLSVSNQEINQLETAKDYGAFIQKHLDTNKGKIAFGGYQEIRNLYKRSTVFNLSLIHI